MLNLFISPEIDLTVLSESGRKNVGNKSVDDNNLYKLIKRLA